jgi:AAA family ATP:ADP antiporter
MAARKEGNMVDATGRTGPGPGAARINLGYRFLRLFADIRPGEASKVLFLSLNVFLLLLAYYILKPLREALLLVDKDSPVVKSCLGGAQAILFIFVIKAFSRLASRVPRHILITWTTLFFISNLVVFYVLKLGGMPIKTMGIVFFIWIGIFNIFVVAQFWGFANDLYTDQEGRRTFPLVAFGATLGAALGTRMAWLRDLMGENWEYKLMLIAGAILLACIGLAIMIHRREVRKVQGEREKGLAGADEKAQVQVQPLKAGGGFRLVFKSRYLLMIALMIGIYNFVNATGEYIISQVTVNKEISRSAPAEKTAAPQGTAVASAAPANAPLPQASGDQKTAHDMEKSIHTAFMDYQFLTNVIALFIQLFLVSRIFRWTGVGGALLFLPFIALGGYALISFGAVFVLVKWVKSLENGTDYSLQNTTKAALFLVTPREEKYKAKAAIDTFFVRGGDTVSALVVLAGTQLLALKIEKYAILNVLGIVVWLGLCFLINREYKKLKEKTDAAQTATT